MQDDKFIVNGLDLSAELTGDLQFQMEEFAAESPEVTITIEGHWDIPDLNDMDVQAMAAMEKAKRNVN